MTFRLDTTQRQDSILCTYYLCTLNKVMDTLITHCTAGYLGQILRSTYMFIWVSKSCTTRPDSRTSFCLKCNLFVLFHPDKLLSKFDLLFNGDNWNSLIKTDEAMTVQCLTFLWVTRQLFLFDTYTLMHEMSSGQWPTRILAEYRVCHVIYLLKISSRNLMPFFFDLYTL